MIILFTQEMLDKIDNNLHENVSIIFDYDFNGLLLLWGGAIKSLIMDIPIRDYDFVLLTQEEDNVLEFIQKNNLDYSDNFGYGYSFCYNGNSIGISPKNDLFDCSLNTDLLFYDVYRKQMIPIGIKNAIVTRSVIILRYDGYPKRLKRVHFKKRVGDAKKMIMFFSPYKKRVKVVGNFKYFIRLCLGFFKKPYKIIKLFRRM